MHLNHSHFPILPGPPSHPSDLLENKRRKKITKSSLYCSYIHRSMVKLPVASPLKVRPTTTKISQLYRAAYTSASFSQIFRVLFSVFLSRLFLFGSKGGRGGGGGGGREDVTGSLLCLSFSTASLQSLVPMERSILALHSQQQQGL